MVDIDTRRIIDLLPSREIGDVAEWLSTFPNLEIVSVTAQYLIIVL